MFSPAKQFTRDSMDVLNVEDKRDSIGKGHVEEQEEEKKDGENGDKGVQEEGTGTINQARMFLFGLSDVNDSLLLLSDQSAAQKQQETGSSPHIGYFCGLQTEVYYYADEKITIAEGLDSYAGMIWPAVSSILVKP